MLVWAHLRSYIYEYNTGRNLTIFDKDYDTAEGSRSRIASNSPGSGGSYSQAYGFATITMYSWWRSSEIEWRTKIAARLRGGVEAGREQSCRTKVSGSEPFYTKTHLKHLKILYLPQYFIKLKLKLLVDFYFN